MAEEITLGVRITGDASSLRGQLVTTGRELVRFAEGGREVTTRFAGARVEADRFNVSARRMGEETRTASIGFRELRNTVVALGLAQLARDTITAGLRLQGMKNALLAVTGSTQAAGEELAFIRREADRLGLPLGAAADGFVKIAAAAKGTSLAGQATRDIFLGVAEAATALQIPAGDVNGILLAISQIMSKGTVAAEELRGQLGERLPGAFQIAARAMGVTTTELQKLLEGGDLAAETFLPRFAAALRTTFAEALPAATRSAASELQRFQNQLLKLQEAAAEGGLLTGLADAVRRITAELKDPRSAQGAADIGKGLGEIAGIAGRGLSTMIEQFNRLPPWVQEVGLFGAIFGGRNARLLLGLGLMVDELAKKLEKLVPLGSIDIGSPPESLQNILSGSLLGRDAGRMLASDNQGMMEFTGFSSGVAVNAPTPLGVARTRSSAEALPRGRRVLGAAEGSFRAAQDAGLDPVSQAEAAFAAYEGLAARAEDAAKRHGAATEEIRRRGLDLVPVWQRMTVEANRWRDEQLAGLDATSAGYEGFAAEVERVHADMLEKAQDEHLRSSREWRDGVVRGLKDMADAYGDLGYQAERSVRQMAYAGEDAFVRLATGADSLGDALERLAETFIEEMLRIQFRAFVSPLANQAANFLGSLFSGGAAAPAPDTNVMANVGHTGGIMGGDALPGRVLPAALFAGAPRLHSGGLIGPGEMPAVLRAGEGVFTPEQMRRMGGGGVVIVDQRGAGAPAIESQERAGADGSRMLYLFVRDAVGRQMRGGELDRDFRLAFGLARAGRSA